MLKHYLLAIESPLTEGQNYLSMFNDLIANDDNAKQAIEKYITWARSNLKKNDRIVWFLRWARVELAGRLKHSDSDTELARLNKRLKTNYSRYDMVPINNLMTNLSHALSMPIEAIQKVVWNRQSPNELLGEFNEAEHEWRETSNAQNTIAYREGDEPTVILQFPDGYAWFDLEKSSCREEGAAMGHCGNTATNGYGDTILSLRKLVRTMDGRTDYYPVCTFILDEDGMLGEMKGRGNDKPAERYHPYIVALLRLPLIHGIKGGGYRPENNFSMRDLDDEIREQLLKEKPDLAEVWDLYSKEGMTKRVLNRVSSGLAANDLSMGTYEPEEKRFLLETWKDFDSFLRHGVYDDDVEKILDIAMGEAEFQHQHGSIDQEFAATLLELPDQMKEKIAAEAGVPRIDDAAMADVAKRLHDQNDDLFQIFHEVYNGTDGIREQAWERLHQYAEAGWGYACMYVWDDIPRDDVNSLREFVESGQPVHLYISERDMVGMASASEGDDDEYASDLWQMRGDGSSPSWEAIQGDNQYENRQEKGLVGNRREGDTWLAGVDTDAASLAHEFMARLQGVHHRGRINDPRQQDLSFESIRRHMILVSKLYETF